MSDMTRKEKVLDVLSDGEWHDGWALCHPSIGGSEGLRRLRELRDAGHQIEKRRKRGSSVYQYRLAGSDYAPLEDCTCLWNKTERGGKFRWDLMEKDKACPTSHGRLMSTAV